MHMINKIHEQGRQQITLDLRKYQCISTQQFVIIRLKSNSFTHRLFMYRRRIWDTMYNHSSCSIRLMSVLFRSSLIKLALTYPLQFPDNTFRYAINGNGIDANNQLLFFIEMRLTHLCIRQRATSQGFKNIDLLIHHFYTTTIG